jgi:hypothetical protein
MKARGVALPLAVATLATLTAPGVVSAGPSVPVAPAAPSSPVVLRRQASGSWASVALSPRGSTA